MGTYQELLDASGLTSAEIAEIRFKTNIICKLHDARKGKGITQKDIERITGIKQPTIAKIEGGDIIPQITTLLRLLEPLGLTLAVVEIEEKTAV
jgi:predicted transcriptional regulator